MTIRRAMVVLVVAGSVAPAAARAEPAEETSAQEEYDRRFIGFDDFGVVDPQTRLFAKITRIYEGKYKRPLEAGDFYRRIGRDDLAQEYAARSARRNTLMAAGGVVMLGSLVASGVIAANALSSASCDPGGSFAAFDRCVSAQSSQARSGVLTAAIVGIGGVLVGGSLFGAGAATNPNPVDEPQMRELADRYNHQLKQHLGISLAPLASPRSAGLALDLRF